MRLLKLLTAAVFILIAVSGLSQKPLSNKTLEGDWGSDDGDIIVFRNDSVFCPLSDYRFSFYEIEGRGFLELINDVDKPPTYIRKQKDSLIFSYGLSPNFPHPKKSRYYYFTANTDTIWGDTLLCSRFYKLKSLPNSKAIYSSLNFKSKKNKWASPRIEISNTGRFLYCYNEKDKWETDTTVYEGTLTKSFLKQLSHLLNDCSEKEITEGYKYSGKTDSTSIIFTNAEGKKCTLICSASSSDGTNALFEFFYNLSSLMHCGYFPLNPRIPASWELRN